MFYKYLKKILLCIENNTMLDGEMFQIPVVNIF